MSLDTNKKKLQKQQTKARHAKRNGDHNFNNSQKNR